MTFLKLLSREGQALYVRPEKIDALEEIEDGTMIVVGVRSFVATETTAEIINRLHAWKSQL